eukprot:1232800-Prymnesium_polylepis.1
MCIRDRPPPRSARRPRSRLEARQPPPCVDGGDLMTVRKSSRRDFQGASPSEYSSTLLLNFSDLVRRFQGRPKSGRQGRRPGYLSEGRSDFGRSSDLGRTSTESRSNLDRISAESRPQP